MSSSGDVIPFDIYRSEESIPDDERQSPCHSAGQHSFFDLDVVSPPQPTYFQMLPADFAPIAQQEALVQAPQPQSQVLVDSQSHLNLSLAPSQQSNAEPEHVSEQASTTQANQSVRKQIKRDDFLIIKIIDLTDGQFDILKGEKKRPKLKKLNHHDTGRVVSFVLKRIGPQIYDSEWYQRNLHGITAGIVDGLKILIDYKKRGADDSALKDFEPELAINKNYISRLIHKTRPLYRIVAKINRYIDSSKSPKLNPFDHDPFDLDPFDYDQQYSQPNKEMINFINAFHKACNEQNEPQLFTKVVDVQEFERTARLSLSNLEVRSSRRNPSPPPPSTLQMRQ